MGISQSRCRGFTLAELMIAMAVGIVLVAGILAIYQGSKFGYLSQIALNQVFDTGRFAMDTLSEDVRRAGYLGGNSDVSRIGGSTGPASAGFGTCAAENDTWGRLVGRPVYGLNDSNSGYACISDSDHLRGDILVLRYAAPREATSFDANRLYLRSSLIEGSLFIGSAQADATNQLASQPLRTSELVSFAYYVGSSSQTCGGAAIPALFRKTLSADGRPVSEEVALGIDNLQVRYGVDQDGTGTANRYLDADSVGDWDDVVSLRLWLLARAGCTEADYTNGNSYVMGDLRDDSAYVPGDGFRRRLYSTVVMLRNRQVL